LSSVTVAESYEFKIRSEHIEEFAGSEVWKCLERPQISLYVLFPDSWHHGPITGN
jgi:hypothetical protein